MKYLAVFYGILSLLAFLLYGLDKYFARHRKRRIPESLLLGIAAAGGAPGAFLAMEIFHHKTRHMSFRVLVPAFIVLHAGLVFYFTR